MHEATGQFAPLPTTSSSPSETPAVEAKSDVVSTHVLVEEEKVEALRDLSRKTRIAQSEFLREAVDDLLTKYGKLKGGT
ncbi:MAG: ribbon-helix-helix domain-containing protein [Myxococcaceae bacterium]|nr:ribbon-helix-helix domain-containing protein [Myxococcaceae bacterium]